MTASFRPDCTIVSLAWASLLRKDSSCAELLQPGLGLFRSPIFLLTEKQPRLNGKVTMARTCFVLHSRGTPGGYANPFSAVLSSRASWRSVLWICNSRHRPCILLCLYGCNHSRDCDSRSAHVSMGKSEKLGKVILRTLSRSLTVSLCLLKSILSTAAPQIAHLIPDAFSRADGRDSDRRFQ